MSIIYKAEYISRDGNIYIYIGKTGQETLEERVAQHKYKARSLACSSDSFQKFMIDFGVENWNWDKLEECDITQENEKEKKWLDVYLRESQRNPALTVLNNAGVKKWKKANTHTTNRYNVPRANLQKNYEKSDLGKIFSRISGQLKPVINLKTKTIYGSMRKASQGDNALISHIRTSCVTGKKLVDGTRYAYLKLDGEPNLTEGHLKDWFIIMKKSKKIKNLINGKIYDDVEQAAKVYKTTAKLMHAYAKGEYAICQDKWVFCYLSEDGVEKKTDKHIKAVEKIQNKDKIKYGAWPVDDMQREFLTYYKTLDELCEKLHIKNISHIKSVCDGKRSHVEGWRVANCGHETNELILKELHLKKSTKVIRKVICLDDEKHFNNCTEAGRYYSINSSQIRLCAEGVLKSNKIEKNGCKLRVRFAYLDQNGNPEMTPTHIDAKKSLSHRGKKKIKLINYEKIKQLGKEEFNSVAEYCRETGVPPKRARKYMRDNSINLLGYEFKEI